MTRWGDPAEPPFKWVGGKRQLARPLLPRLGGPIAAGARLFEPFVGGGYVTFALAPRAGVIADVNPRLVRTYRALRDTPADVVARLIALARTHSEAAYYRVRGRPPDDDCDAAIAAWFVYIIRAGFNGLYRENASGGCNTPKGNCDDPARLAAPARLLDASRVLQRIDVRLGDFTITTADAVPGDLVYFDPPYLPDRVGGFRAYAAGGFSPDDHRRLEHTAWQLHELGVRVVVSNSSTPETSRIFPTARWLPVPVRARRLVSATVEGRAMVTEVILVPRPVTPRVFVGGRYAPTMPVATSAAAAGTCGCGCGQPVPPSRLYVNLAHRQAAHRRRTAGATTLPREVRNNQARADRLQREAEELEQKAAQLVHRATELRATANVLLAPTTSPPVPVGRDADLA